LAKILIAGAFGLLGSSLSPHLAALDHEVICHGRRPRDGAQADLTSLEETFALLSRNAPDVIVNLVALTDVDRCETHPAEAHQLNVGVVENIAKWIRQSPRDCFLVQVSTDQVYADPGPHPESDIQPRNKYAESKLRAEVAAAQVPSVVLRTNFFGRSLAKDRNSLSDWLVASLRSRKEITVFTDILFSPLSLQTLSTMIEVVLERRETGVFNLGSRQGASKAEFAFALADILGLPAASMTRGESSSRNSAAYRPKDMRMDSTAFETKFRVELPTLAQELKSMEGVYGRETR
jgi:dTDP-4-dehydrorhamnose reductase